MSPSQASNSLLNRGNDSASITSFGRQFRIRKIILVYKSKKIIGNPNFSNLLKRIVNRFRRAGHSLDIMRQTACLVFNPIMVEGYAALFSCTAVVQASDSMTASM